MPFSMPETKDFCGGRDIPGFPAYTITKDGRVWSKPRKSSRGQEPGRWLTNTTQTNGYVYTHLNVKGKQYHFRLSCLILLAFVGPRPKGTQCRHLDGDKQNNYLTNLKWGTPKENIQDAIKHGTHPCLRRGAKSNRSILSENQVKLIFNAYHDGAYNQQELADTFNVSDAHISRIVNKKNWGHLWLN